MGVRETPRRGDAEYASPSGAGFEPDLVEELHGELAVHERERAEKLKRRLLRLALDVHDGPMQNLTAIGLSLGALRARIEDVVPAEHRAKLSEPITQITDELVKVEQELRELIHALNDGASKTIPLLDAIETEIREFRRNSLAHVELHYDGDVQARTDSQRIALQSITRSALANIARHADADSVTIRLDGTPDTIHLEIEDDGRGFDTSVPPKPGRLGMVGMKERAELLGGEFTATSRPGGPTIISVVLQSWSPHTGVAPL